MDIRALVVDDSRIMRQMVKRTLMQSKLAQFFFTEAEDGQDALEKFNPDEIDMLFVDWNMPNMTGIDLVRAIRANQKKHVPIVMITTEGTMAKVEEAVDQAGVDSYIIKPFTAEVLVKKLTPLFEKLREAGKKKQGFFSGLAAKLG